MNRDVVGSLMWAAGIIGLALGATWARGQGWIDENTTSRLVLVAIGLMIAWYGNRTPKSFVPSARARQARRVAGWSLAISGLIYAAAFAFAPMDLALILGCGSVALGIAVTFLYCLSLRGKAEAA